MKILDCTLRDGGYYTHWDFSKPIIDQYIRSINALPIAYVEIGYRNKPSPKYQGKYAYSPLYEIQNLRNKTDKKLSVMLDEKNVSSEDVNSLIDPVCGLIDMIRIAVDPNRFEQALKLASNIKKAGFEVGFNVMYMSKWNTIKDFKKHVSKTDGLIDYFFMVDSYGSITPREVENTITMLKKCTEVSLGFHGHNNLELSLINTITAIENGIEIADTTILGMGRGAGNLKTELLLTYLNSKYELMVDFNSLGKVITIFTPLLKKHDWGTNLPYMLSGANSFPQKEVMEWSCNRIYSFNSIVRAVSNKRHENADDEHFPILKVSYFENVLIVGGGNSVAEHYEGIKEFLKNKKNIAVINATARNAYYFSDINAPQYFCIVGSEGERLENSFSKDNFQGCCILPPYPRIMGTDVPPFVRDKTYELASIDFSMEYGDSCTAIALQASIELKAKAVYIVGYDGYPEGLLTQKERDLSTENEVLFALFKKKTNIKLLSLTPSLYNGLEVKSLYQFI